MKNLIFIFGLFCFHNSNGQKLTYKDLIGIWKLKDSSSIAALEFLDSTHVVYYDKNFPNPQTYTLDNLNAPANKLNFTMTYIMHNKHTGKKASVSKYFISKPAYNILIVEWADKKEVYIKSTK